LGGYANKLSSQEFDAFQAYMKKRYNMDVNEDELSVHGKSSTGTQTKGSNKGPDSKSLSLKWLTARAQRQMRDDTDDNPYSDLMPGDLSPTRLVNRKRAKIIPRRLLHHNNIPLLKTFITPTGQIQNRIQTRLGARDQRKIAKLIRRARCMGLIPYLGQFKVERHGWWHAKDINEEKPWEKELVRRGLVIKRDLDNTED
jgi:ribosomal protein S18